MTDQAGRTGRLAGGLYLALMPFGIFAFVYVPARLLVAGDALATARNLLSSEPLFRAASVSHLISQVLVVFLALALYRLIEPVHQGAARLMLALVLIGVPISVHNEVNNLAALGVLRASGVGADSAARAATFLEMARNGIFLAQVFWALWMFPFAWALWRARLVPRALAVTAAIAGAGYLFDSTTQLLFPGAPGVTRYTAGLEVLLPLWLAIRGAPTQQRP